MNHLQKNNMGMKIIQRKNTVESREEKPPLFNGWEDEFKDEVTEEGARQVRGGKRRIRTILWHEAQRNKV